MASKGWFPDGLGLLLSEEARLTGGCEEMEEDSWWQKAHCWLLTRTGKSLEDQIIWGKISHYLLPVAVLRVSVVEAVARDMLNDFLCYPAQSLSLSFSLSFPAPTLTQMLHKLPPAMELLRHFIWSRTAPLTSAVVFVFSFVTAFFSFHEHCLSICVDVRHVHINVVRNEPTHLCLGKASFLHKFPGSRLLLEHLSLIIKWRLPAHVAQYKVSCVPPLPQEQCFMLAVEPSVRMQWLHFSALWDV